MSLAMGQVTRWVWYPFGVTIRFLMRNGKRIGVSIAGLVLVVLGLVMLVLPGPGVLILLAGLAVLATEYVWAQRMLNYAKRKAGQAKDAVLRKKSAEPDPTGSIDPEG